MYVVSDEYTELMNNDRSRLKVSIECDFGDGAFILDGDVVEYIDLNERVNDNSNILTFGNACANSVSIKLREPPILQYKGLKCKPSCGIELSDGSVEKVPLGVFWVDKAKTNNDYKTVMITALDKMYHLGGAYTTSLEYPALFADVVAEFEALAGVKIVEPTEFPAFYITTKVEDGKYTFRDMAAHLAGCLGKNATFNRDGDLEFVYYTQTAVKATEDLQYLNGFEKLADNALKIDYLVTGSNGEIKLENDGSDPGKLDWSAFDIPAAEDLPMFAFTFDTDAGTASCALNDGYKANTDKMYIPNAVVYQGVVCYITSIPANGFKDCKASSIILPNKLETIGGSAFANCSNVVSVEIPRTVTSIGQTAFYNCTALETVYWNALAVTSAGSIGSTVFKGCSKFSRCIFAEDVTIIPNYAFRECSGLVSVTIPASVTRVGNDAFRDCTSLTAVYWNPPALSSAGSYSAPPFNGCKSLVNFVFAENVTVIPAYILKSCTGLTSVTIPASVTSVGQSSFQDCSALVSVSWRAKSVSTAGTYSSPAFANCKSLANFVFEYGVETVPSYLLDGTNVITALTLPDTVKAIYGYSFSKCTKLATVKIGETADCKIATISSSAFGSSVTSIEIHALTGTVTGSPWGASNASISWVAG